MQKGPIAASLLILVIIATQLAWAITWESFTHRLTFDPPDIPVADKYSSITQARDGRIWVAWQREVNGYGAIYYTTSSDLGQTWSEPKNLTKADAYKTYEDMTPEITQTTDGTIWVVWASNRPDARFYDYDVYYRTSSDNGATWSQITRLLITNNNVNDMSPSITQAMNGTIYIAWSKQFTDDTEIMLTSSSDNGETWSIPPMQLTSNSDDDSSPSIIQTIDAKIWVAWDCYKNDLQSELYYRIYDGTYWLAPEIADKLNTNVDEITPSLVGSANGVVWIFWDKGDSFNGAPNSIYYSYTSDNGAHWASPILLSLPDLNNHSWPSATHTKDSTIWVVWASNSTADYELYYRTTITGDLTGPEYPVGSGEYPPDGKVTQYDLALMGKAYGTKAGDLLWSEYQIADITGPINPPNTLWYPPDEVVSVYDLTAIGKNYGKM